METESISFSPDEFFKLSSVIDKFTEHIPNQTEPELALITGTIASGKTTLINKNLCLSHVYIDFDNIFPLIADTFIDSSKEKLNAFAIFCFEHIVTSSFEQHKNIVMEFMGEDKNKMDIIINEFKKRGYKIALKLIDAPIETCIERAKLRNQQQELYPSVYYSEPVTYSCLMNYFANDDYK